MTIKIVSSWTVTEEVHRNEKRRAPKPIPIPVKQKAPARSSTPKNIAEKKPQPLVGIAANCRPWTEEERRIVVEKLPILPFEAVAELVGRTPRAIRSEVFRMRLRGNNAPPLQKPNWTTGEQNRLRYLWKQPLSIENIAKEFNRPPGGVYSYATEVLRLPTSKPEGFDYMHNVAKLCGYHNATLARICAWANVPILAARSEPRNKKYKTNHKRHIVNVEAARRACGAWGATESVKEAATRVGLHHDVLRRALRKAGFEKHPATGSIWRVTKEEVERALALRATVGV